MICPLCQIDVPESKLIATPLWQATSLELAHKMNPDWDELDGCCRLCFDGVVETLEAVWFPETEYVVKGVSSGRRYVLSEGETKNWNHINPDLQRWWQKKIVDSVSEAAIGAGYTEWFIFRSDETVLAQGRVT